jgi:hypothetical protein
VTGAIAPASVNGVMHTTWLRSANAMIPCSIGASRRNGEDEFTTVNTDGSSSSCSSLMPRAMRTISSTSTFRWRPSE